MDPQPLSPTSFRSGLAGATRKGTNGFSTNVAKTIFMFFDRGTLWVLPLTYFYLPKSARAYLFPQSLKTHYAAPLVLTPFVRNQATSDQGVGLDWFLMLGQTPA